MPANKQIQSNLIKHQIGIIQLSEKYGKQLVGKINGTNKELAGLLNQKIPRLPKNVTSRKFNTAIKKLAVDVNAVRAFGKITPIDNPVAGIKAAESFYLNEMRILAENEAKYVDKLIHREVGIPFNTKVVPTARLNSLVAFSSFQGETLNQWFKTLEANDTARIMRTVRSGIIDNKGTAGIARDVFNTEIPKTMRSAEMLARTTTNGIANQSKMEFYKQNEDIIQGVIFVATLDGRTSLICISYDGEKWTDLNKAVTPPLHPNCRSVLSPYVSAEGVVGDRIAVGDRNFRADAKDDYVKKWVVDHGETRKQALGRWNNLDTGTINGYMNKSRNAYMEEVGKNVIGKVPAKISYSDWLKTQDKSFVEGVLGKSKANLFLSGKADVKSFVNRGNKTVKTLSQIKK